MSSKNSINNIGKDDNPQIDVNSLTQADIDELRQQGIMPEQLAEIAISQGQQVPPLIKQMMSADNPGVQLSNSYDNQTEEQASQSNQANIATLNKTSKFPAMMGLPEYAQYSKVDKAEQLQKKKDFRFGAHKQKMYGYMFSDLISEELLRDIKRTQGSFLVGVNLSNLFSEVRNISTNMAELNTITNKNNRTKKRIEINKKTLINSEALFKKIGEYVNVDFDKVLEKKMGFRGHDIPLLPELVLTDNSSFLDIISESKKYADTGYSQNITPAGLLIMARMLYKYRKNNAQWIRVSTVLELIYKYFGDNQTRIDFFKNTDNISVLSLIELEEFYNTDHIFMLEEELIAFKQRLDFYKYESDVNIKKQLNVVLSKKPPII